MGINKQKSILCLLNCLLCMWLCTGCSPKRVVNNEILTNESVRRQEKPASKAKPKSGSRSESTVGGVVPAGKFANQAVELAKNQLGKMYQWGGQGPDRFDCSGLVYYVYGNLGVSMPRVSDKQAKVGREIERSNLQPGDMLYFATSGSSINHVGIYLGHAKFIHAPRKGMPVRTDSLNNGWWRQKYRGARRIKG